MRDQHPSQSNHIEQTAVSPLPSVAGIEAETEPGQAAPQIDPAKAAALFEQLVARQNLMLGIVGGLIGAVTGAALWAVITVMTGYQIGYMAIGIGFLVAILVRFFGKGLTTPFGVVGAVCSLLGCLLGNLLAVCGMAAIDSGESVVGVTLTVLTQPPLIVELLVSTFSPMDFLFYGIAVYEGYKLSFRQVTEQELAELTA
jgi:hypothetical protein